MTSQDRNQNNGKQLPPIKFADLNQVLLQRAESLVTDWLPGGAKRGHEYVCGSLAGGKGTSCSVNLTTGQWADFAADEKGNDLTGLYAAIHGLGQTRAAVQVAREEGLEDVAGVLTAPGTAPVEPRPARPVPVAVATPRQDEGWRSVTPVPGFAPAPNFWHPYRQAGDIEHSAKYEIDKQLQGYVVRFRTSDGGKETLPLTWCISAKDGAARWHWKMWDDPRPLYFPGGVSPLEGYANGCADDLPTVILVEGEKKAGILHDLLLQTAPDVYLVASWPGGCKAWKKTDWQRLAGCTVLLWPDCDAKRVALTKAEREAGMAPSTKPLLPAHKQPGMAAMLGIGALLRDNQGCSVALLPIPEPGSVPDGWDCADAIAVDGWNGERVLAFFGQAQPLPVCAPAPAPAPEDAPVKKIAGLVDSGATGFADCDAADDSGSSVIAGRVIPDWLSFLLAPLLAYNELSNTIQARAAWPWKHAPKGDVTDAVDLMLGKYLSDKYGLPSMPRAALIEAIQTVAHARRFHPIREYLEGVKWDGKSRIDKWLMYVIGDSPQSLPKPMVEYLEIVGRCWLLGMIKRAIDPGCKFDYCPVLEGVGGLRKSTLVEVLAGSSYYSDTPFDVGHGKEAQEQVQGVWLYEVAELSNFSKAEVGAIKGFISSKVDRYRVAYGVTVGSFPRQCVLVGTTNENTYLRDRTGNRRFWPIPVKHVINTEWIEKYRDQLMAEAYALCQQDPKLAYTPTVDQERRLFAPMQESRLQETAVVSELLNLLTRSPTATVSDSLLTRSPTATVSGSLVNELTNFVTMAQLTLALGVDAAKSTPGLEGQIRGWLDHQGWKREKRQIEGRRAWGYSRPANWPPLDDAEDMRSMPEPAPVVPGALIEPGDDEPF